MYKDKLYYISYQVKHMATKVLIKNMDEQLYRMLKARAALLGISVSEAIQQATFFVAQRYRRNR